MNTTGGVEHSVDGCGYAKEKQRSATQHTQELNDKKQTIAMMQAQMERLEHIIMTQHNTQQKNLTIARIVETQQCAEGSLSVVSADIVPSPLTGAQGSQAL